jgi:hypothetical protein
VSEEKVKARGFIVYPNNQLSRLGDGKTMLPSVREIHKTFFRNEWSVKFQAVVVRLLHTGFVVGTTFLADNTIDQRFKSRSLYIHDKKYSHFGHQKLVHHANKGVERKCQV